MATFDWNAEALRPACYVRDQMFEAHRGVLRYSDGGLLVVFGNNNYQSAATVKEVALFRTALDAEGGKVLGFAVEPENHSWAAIVSVDEATARSMLFRAWARSHGVDTNNKDAMVFAAWQARIAEGAIEREQPKPESMN